MLFLEFKFKKVQELKKASANADACIGLNILGNVDAEVSEILFLHWAVSVCQILKQELKRLRPLSVRLLTNHGGDAPIFQHLPILRR